MLGRIKCPHCKRSLNAIRQIKKAELVWEPEYREYHEEISVTLYYCPYCKRKLKDIGLEL